jgi:4-aminobutyrate aminotransferase / (S)-3-amino-2-methylpropionate transaminase / 5-aminovalerate transaminase
MATSFDRIVEPRSEEARRRIAAVEPPSQRTYTPSLAVIAKSSGIFHWTADGHRLYDFTSGVLVTNLGHNLPKWTERFRWYTADLPFNAYNATTPVEIEASSRLIALLQACRGGSGLAEIVWAASGSEAIQKALWACLAHAPERDIILAPRYGFHGKKGLAHAVSGCESDPDRDPRVRFISFPMQECHDLSLRDSPFDPTPYRSELESLWSELGPRIGTLITEPYLGAAGSYHPPPAYLQMLQAFCSEHHILFVLDEVQSNFGRTNSLFAFEAYDLDPDLVVLGKSLANGVPVAAVAGRPDVLNVQGHGEASDTWSANPLSCAGVCATLDSFFDPAVLANAHRSSNVIEAGLVRLKELPFVAHVRGERGGMVWGVEMRDHAGRSAAEWANDTVLSCYHGENGTGVHLLGPLARKVLRIAPPLVITPDESSAAIELMYRCLQRIAQ